MIDSIKQKLEKLNPIEPTSLKKAGVFIGILYHDEFIENPESIIAAGYIGSNDDSTSPYRYKLKPYYGFMHFDYKATDNNFKLEWVSGEAKVIRARVTNDDSPKLLLENYCEPGGETCYEHETGSSYL